MIIYANNTTRYQSFANFVLEVVKPEEALAMGKEVKKKGSWATVRDVIVLVITSLIILVAFGQPDFFDNVNSIVLALTGIVGVLPTLSSLFSTGNKLKTGAGL